MDKKAVAQSEAAGCAIIYITAVFLHFIYPLSGGTALSILFGAVNESVWEHTKIFSVGYIGWAVIQLCWLRVHFRRYVVAKCIGLYTLMGLIIGSYYFFTAILGGHFLWINILSSLAAVILTQLLTYRLETDDNDLADYFAPSLVLLTIYYVMFFSFTAFPPKMGLFRDPIGGFFGIPDRQGA